MSYVDRRPQDHEPQPIRNSPSRLSLFGACVMLMAVPLSRFAQEHGWIPNKTTAEIVLGGIGLGCIFGAWIAYRSSQRQVKRDLEEVQSAGKPN